MANGTGDEIQKKRVRAKKQKTNVAWGLRQVKLGRVLICLLISPGGKYYITGDKDDRRTASRRVRAVLKPVRPSVPKFLTYSNIFITFKAMQLLYDRLRQHKQLNRYRESEGTYYQMKGCQIRKRSNIRLVLFFFSRYDIWDKVQDDWKRKKLT